MANGKHVEFVSSKIVQRDPKNDKIQFADLNFLQVDSGELYNDRRTTFYFPF